MQKSMHYKSERVFPGRSLSGNFSRYLNLNTRHFVSFRTLFLRGTPHKTVFRYSSGPYMEFHMHTIIICYLELVNRSKNILHRKGWCSSNALASYLGAAWFESWPEHGEYILGSLWISSAPPRKYRDGTSIRARPPLFKSFSTSSICTIRGYRPYSLAIESVIK
jgi:hypothetical protein